MLKNLARFLTRSCMILIYMQTPSRSHYPDRLRMWVIIFNNTYMLCKAGTTTEVKIIAAKPRRLGRERLGGWGGGGGGGGGATWLWTMIAWD